jgi:phenylalanyl-tRNA synthetase alpha chain
MSLPVFLAALDELAQAASAAFASAYDTASLEAARVEFLGAKSGRLKSVQQGLGAVDGADRPAAGKRFNEVKQAIQAAFQEAQDRAGSGRAGVVRDRDFDPTVPGRPFRLGRLHPITQTIEELKDIMGRLGFTVALGPEIEDEWHNFEALNIPADHPARDPLENFYLATAQSSGNASASAVTASPTTAGSATTGSANAGSTATGSLPPSVSTAASGSAPLLLRSQTSTVQVRVMESREPPVRIISLGRVYRPDTADATHYPMFHQMEGLLVDRRVTMADLKSVLRLFAASYLGADVHIRFRPSFFPFTEPSVEVDMSWKDRWIEFGGAGMVDPNVLRSVGYDPEIYTGFAFGLGVERLCMRRHGITDIRELYKNDVRFLGQF